MVWPGYEVNPHLRRLFNLHQLRQRGVLHQPYTRRLDEINKRANQRWWEGAIKVPHVYLGCAWREGRVITVSHL